jgi:hypothetical protein
MIPFGVGCVGRVGFAVLGLPGSTMPFTPFAELRL